VRITAKADYAVRAAVELARHLPADTDPGAKPVPITRQAIAEAQAIPAKFLENILADLKRSRIVSSARGAEGGYWLRRPPEEITMADVIRAVEGPLADVRGERPEDLAYPTELEVLQRAWVALRANLRAVLEHVTLADLRDGRLDPDVEALANQPDAWTVR
jgi:Rrf2 family protein